MTLGYIEHEGVVVRTDRRRGVAYVRLSAMPDCRDCPAAADCVGVADKGTPMVTALSEGKIPAEGSHVTVRVAQRLKPQAMGRLTILVSVLLAAVMVGVFFLTSDVLASVAGGIAVMIFAILLTSLFRSHIPRETIFEIPADRRP